ncbi:MAG: T9SS type A sorting domain-containing protein [Nonlabens sp.]
MNKKYFKALLLSVIVAGTTCAQVLQSEDFNSLTIGNVGTDIDFSTAGQGGFFTLADNVDAGATTPTTTTNAANSNFQIITGGLARTQGLRIVGPNGDQGARQITKGDFSTAFTNRTVGNDIVEVEIYFNTGTFAISETFSRILMFGDDAGTSRIPVGLQFNQTTGELSGLANLLQAGAVGFFGFNLGAANTDLILPPSTWVHVGMAYDTTNGALRWAYDAGNMIDGQLTFTNAANVIPGMAPNEVDLLLFTGATNTIATSVPFDNLEVRATATNQLLNAPSQEAVLDVAIYPNPATDFVTLRSDTIDLAAYTITDLSGKLLVKQAVNGTTERIDISNLSSGIYLLQIESVGGGLVTKKVIKQ